MVIFESEQDMVQHLDLHDKIVFECINGQLDFWTFCNDYNNFYDYCALDGHESDAEELALLTKYRDRILIHEQIRDEILYKVCKDIDADKPDYIASGRFGSIVALEKLKLIGRRHA
jgi:hypothetical protein